MIGNKFELRLFLYLKIKSGYYSPFGMNIVTQGVLMVERLINICGIRAYLYSNIYQVLILDILVLVEIIIGFID